MCSCQVEYEEVQEEEGRWPRGRELRWTGREAERLRDAHTDARALRQMPGPRNARRELLSEGDLIQNSHLVGVRATRACSRLENSATVGRRKNRWNEARILSIITGLTPGQGRNSHRYFSESLFKLVSAPKLLSLLVTHSYTMNILML